jgi:DNA-binding CsgD family transcriptional regulator
MRFNSAAALARLRLRRGDPGIEPLIAELRYHLQSNHELQRLAPYATLLAEQAWLNHGDRQQALDALAQAHALSESAHVHAELPVWALRLGGKLPVPAGAPMPPPYRAELDGNLKLAAELWRQRGAHFDAAMALAGGDEAAQREAVAAFDAMSAQASADRVRALMRQRGIANVAKGPRAATRANALGLTQREMEVLKLVDRGLSSKRIAAELDISPKTVDHHVAAMMEKLGAHTRVAASAVARDAGLL